MDQPASTSSVLRQPGKEKILPENKASELVSYPHHVLAENNLYAEENIRMCQDVYSLSSTYHLPYLPPNSTGRDGSGVVTWDPVSTLVHDKNCWKERTNYIVKGHGKKYLKTFEELYPESGKANTTMPKFMADFLDIVDQDPDSEFDGVTNWFYSGGRLSHILIDGQNVLLSSCGPKNEHLYMIPLENEELNGWHPVLSATSKLELPETSIHQIVAKSIENSKGLIGIRRRNTCSLYEMTSSEGCLELNGMHSTKTDNIYTSMDISEEDVGHYCTSGVNRQVTLWDTTVKRAISSHIIEKPKYSLQNPWSSIHFVKRTFSLMFSDTCSLNFLDTRVKFDKPALTFYPKDGLHILSPCDDISLVFPSAASDNAIYVGTNHHLCQYDPRSVGIVKRWTHMLKSPPLYSHMVTENTDREWICIANQEPAEVEIIVNGLPGGNDFDNLTFPFLLPTMVESLHKRNMNGQFLDPRVQQRLRACVTGVLLLPCKSNSLQVLTQTSLGDIFTQDVTRDKTLEARDSDTYLSDWENKVVNMVKTPQIYTTNKQDVTAFFEDLKDSTLETVPFNSKVILHESIKVSKSMLKKYKDKLASELLEAWNIKDQPDWATDQEESDYDELSDSSLETLPQSRQKKCNISIETTPKISPSKNTDNASQSTPSLVRVVSTARKTPTSAAKRKANVSGF